jgi:inosine-uridine nucleoside N-ribohydrolase
LPGNIAKHVMKISFSKINLDILAVTVILVLQTMEWLRVVKTATSLISSRFAVCLILLIPMAVCATPIACGQVKVILETDMESDIDDAATLAMLHALANNGECEIIAVMHNTSDDYGVGVIDAINTYYGRPDIPIGAYKANDAPSVQFGGETRYAESIARNPLFPKDIISRDQVPDAVEIYKRILTKHSNRSVVIVSVGWTMNLKNLLLSKQGDETVRKSVLRLVVMGGKWNPPEVAHRISMNLAGNQIIAPAYEAGKYVIDNWPTEMVFSGIPIGGKVWTGERLKDTPEVNPVREAFRIYKAKHHQENWGHPSWDQTAALFAVRGEGKLWTLCSTGTPQIFLKSNIKERYLRWHTKWNSSVDSEHSYLQFAANPGEIAGVIEELMISAPKEAGDGKGAVTERPPRKTF